MRRTRTKVALSACLAAGMAFSIALAESSIAPRPSFAQGTSTTTTTGVAETTTVVHGTRPSESTEATTSPPPTMASSEVTGPTTTSTAAAPTPTTPLPTPSITLGEALLAYIRMPAVTARHSDVLRLYWALFDRVPDLGGAQYWIDQSNKCASLGDIAYSFQMSDEFRLRYGSLTGGSYLELVYNNVLDRRPDQAGADYWLKELSGGMDRSRLMLYFALSSEFRTAHALPGDGRPDEPCVAPPPPSTITTSQATATVAKKASGPFRNCKAARAAGRSRIPRGDPAYASHLDRDGDGIACE
jgi:hypothetical protein